MISWGIRMGLSGTLPIVWGLATGRLEDATWITLTAEAISWVEMKGSFAWRVRTLIYGAILAILFAIFGTLTGFNVWLSVIGMFIVGYIATVLKDIGDRASGLGLCVYLLFIICNAYPATEYADVKHRLFLVTIGALWPIIVGVCASLLMPEEEPFRRQIALIWRSISSLVEAISKTGVHKNMSYVRDVYLKENEVRNAINNSFDFYGKMAHQLNPTDNKQFQLGQLRKAAGLVAVNVIAMGEEMSHIIAPGLDEPLRVKAASLYSAMKEAVSRISIFVITLKPEEKLLAASHINRLKKLTQLIKESPQPADAKQAASIKRTLQLTERTIKLLESAIQRIDTMGVDKPVFRSYSFTKTLFVVKPRYFFNSLRVLFNYNTFTTRYALRSAIAATIALFIFKWFHVDHGYWLPFSVMIIIQPYFGATFKRAVDRVVGTLLGGLAGGLLMYLPAGLHAKEGILFLTFILMVYYIRKHYAIAAFIITLNLVLLFNLDASYSNMLMVTRALCTIGGATLAVFAGFALLPTWDSKYLPKHLAGAINCNYQYFIDTFFSNAYNTGWIKNKRTAESKNSNVFDSFKRYMEDPGKTKSEVYYDLITNNVRITRNLNNIHLEQDEKKVEQFAAPGAAQQARIYECLVCFHQVLNYLHRLDPTFTAPPAPLYEGISSPFALNDTQIVSLEKLFIELKTMKDDMEKLISETLH